VNIGISTGILHEYECNSRLEIANKISMNSIEISYLRKKELKNNLNSLDKYEYVSIHAPSDINKSDEEDIAYDLYQKFFQAKRNIILHPNAIVDFDIWKNFGNLICIENMDARKKGKNTKELLEIFNKLPYASFCLDIGHSRQIDRSMTETLNMLREFSNRIKQIHISEVDVEGKHWPISNKCLEDFKKISNWLPKEIPYIIESLVKEEDILEEIGRVNSIFN